MATIILAGGMSSRMGTDKAALAMGESTLLRTLVARFAGKLGRVVVVLRAGQELHTDEALTVHDQYQGAGPLGGLHAGLTASPDDDNFLLACDMPFADPDLARYLVSLVSGHDAVVPMLQRGPEPLHAVYSKSALPVVESSLARGQFRMRDALHEMNVRYVPEDEVRRRDPQLRGFLNVNTPEEYLKALDSMQTSQ